MAIQVAEADVPLPEVIHPKARADVPPVTAAPSEAQAHPPEAQRHPSDCFDPDLTVDDDRPAAARGIILAASISAPIWALIAFAVFALR